jgi:coenzyme PQQ precursor peptide PqqA
MPWTKPDFEEINLSGEVTAYVNSDEEVRKSERSTTRIEPAVAAGEKPDNTPT